MNDATDPPGARGSSSAATGLAVAFPTVLHVAFVAILGAWIVDDAGISFAYARNVAEGHGFVSQPGRIPVEGFSNFLWVLVLVPFFWLGLFDPVITPKLLAVAMIAACFALLQRTLRRHTGSPWPGMVASLLVAAASPIVIWSASGLENSLTLLLACALFSRLADRRPRWAAEAGVLIALLAMNRPEAPVLLAAGVLACWLPQAPGPRLARIADSARLLGGFALVFGLFLAFRLSVFGLPFPHPYYAKRVSPDLASRLLEVVGDPLALLDRITQLGHGIVGPAAPVIFLATASAVVVVAVRERVGDALRAALLLQLVSLFAYVWIDADWMREFRFATIVTAFTLVTLALVFFDVTRAARAPRLFLALGAALIALLYVDHLPRIARFAAEPTTPFGEMERRYARRFDAYARALGLEGGSVLLPDAGAPVYYSRLEVYDLAGLFEPDVVRTLKGGTIYWYNDKSEFHRWVLDELRPTFIATHDFWTYVAGLESSDRFIADYVPIESAEDEYVARAFGVRLRSGEFVRRDVLKGPQSVADLRAAYRASAPSPPPLERLRDSLFGEFSEDTDALMQRALEARYAANEPGRAARAFARVVARLPDHYGANYQLAAALDAAGRYDDARPVWEKVRALAERAGDAKLLAQTLERLESAQRPSLSSLMESGVALLYEQNDPAGAAERFQQVLQRLPTHYGATYQLATALDRAGRRTEARPHWEKALALAESIADAKTAAVARQRLASGS